MPRYAVTITLSTVIEAASYEDAVKLADELNVPQDCDNQDVEIEEIDGDA
jgi:hypothetical protein